MKGILYTDGGARGNPGPGGIGIVLEDGEGEVVLEHAESIGHTTNNVAEYRALIKGLELALDEGYRELEVRLDSQLVAMQVQGLWKIKTDRLRSLAASAEALLGRLEKVSIRRIPRLENRRADRLANEGMDAAAAEPGGAPRQSQIL